MKRMTVMLVGLGLAFGCGGPGPGTGRGTTPSDPEPGSADAQRQQEGPGEPELVRRPGESPVVTLRVVFDAGSAADPRGLEGVTHFAARLMAEGGAGDRSTEQVSRALYPMAAELSARAGRDQTVFVGRVHRDHLERFYGIFRDVLRAPRMEQSDFRRIKAQLQSELVLELRGNDDEELGKEALQALLYEGHPYGHPSIGTETGLEAIEMDDVRRQRERVLCGGRATVGVAGSYPEGFAERVRDDMASIRFDACGPRRPLPEPETVRSPRVMLVDKDEAQSVAMSMGLHVDVTRAHPDYPALVLATAYLGQHRQFVGRLMQQIRGKRGLNYGDYAYIEHFDQQGWTRFPLPNIARRQQYFSIWIRPVELDKAHFVLRAAVRELDRFVEQGLAQDDFERIRTFCDRYYALYLQDASRRLGFAIDDQFHGNDGPWLERLRARWSELTAEEVNRVIREHIDPGRLQVALVHPEAEDFADALASDAPSPIEYAHEKPEPVRREDEAIASYELAIGRDRIRIVPVEQLFR